MSSIKIQVDEKGTSNLLPQHLVAPKGRPKGSKNKYNRKTEASDLARRIVLDSEYFEKLLIRAKAGILNSGVEIMLWYYSFGKPLSRSEIIVKDDTTDYSDMSDHELAQKASDLAQTAMILAEESKKNRATA